MCCYQEKRWGFAGAALGWGGLVPRGTVCKALTYSSKSFSFKPDSAGSLHKPLSFIHQRQAEEARTTLPQQLE